jgi:hypothetical protein
MDEKTEELRDIFTSVTDGEATVTESQEDTRGSLEKDERSVEDRLADLIDQMRERYAFETDLSTAELRTVAQGFYEDRSDAAIAQDLGVDADAVFEARMSLHLYDDADVDGIDLSGFREAADRGTAALAAEYAVDPAQIERYRRVLAARDESIAANDRYRDEFESLLADADLSSHMTSDVRDDGLEDATEGMETDVSF